MKSLSLAVLVVLLHPIWLPAAVLDNPNPQTGVIQSGIFPVFGWKCDAGRITIRVNGSAEIEAIYGNPRDDTIGVCGDSNNGFELLANWNELRDGTHVIEALDNGVVFARVTVRVVTLGQPYLRGLTGTGLVTLSTGQQVTVEWSESRQGFIITGVSDRNDFPVTPGVWLGSGKTPPVLSCFHVAEDGRRLTAQGSPCFSKLPAESLGILITNLTVGCRAELETAVDIPIVNGAFFHQEVVGDQTIRVNGTFQLPNFASGTVRATNNNTGVVCEGSWLATPGL